jgi:heme exporter protein A
MRLTAADLHCHRGGRDVFSGVGFTLAAGEALIVGGRNGAGKSSLLRLVGGLLRLSQGRLTLEDGDPELSIAEQAHYLGHQDALKPALSVGENLRFWAGFFGVRSPDLAAALDAVGLAALAGLPAAYLSAGQRRRLSIARLVAVKRPIWLLDEPTSTLDAAAQERLAGLMQDHLAGGGLILAATHGPIGLTGAKELRLGSPSPLVGEGRGGGSGGDPITSTPSQHVPTPTPNPSPTSLHSGARKRDPGGGGKVQP